MSKQGHNLFRVFFLLRICLVGGAATLLMTACRSQSAPAVAEGRVGGVTVAVPSKMILGGMLYEGEDVWDPSTRKERRPDGQLSSFDVALDRNDWKLVRFSGDRAEVRRNRGRYITVELDRDRVPVDDVGIAARHRDFVEGNMHRRLNDETSDGHGLQVAVNLAPIGKDEIQAFNTNYYSVAPTVNITCNRNVQVVAPYADISTCLEDFALAGVPIGVRAYIRKRDVPQWKRIHDVLQRELQQFFSI